MEVILYKIYSLIEFIPYNNFLKKSNSLGNLIDPTNLITKGIINYLRKYLLDKNKY